MGATRCLATEERLRPQHFLFDRAALTQKRKEWLASGGAASLLGKAEEDMG
ncbi:MAG: hypothetical protein M3441_09730 [Chloroflexota bacterium]|nr:hypothetical protein [Chloroflexota bacterium]